MTTPIDIINAATNYIGQSTGSSVNATWMMRNITHGRDGWRYFAELAILDAALMAQDSKLKFVIESAVTKGAAAGAIWNACIGSGCICHQTKPTPGSIALFRNGKTGLAFMSIVGRCDGGLTFQSIEGDESGRYIAIERERSVSMPYTETGLNLVGFITMVV